MKLCDESECCMTYSIVLINCVIVLQIGGFLGLLLGASVLTVRYWTTLL